MTAKKWWETNCPICGENETVTAQEDTIRYCRECKFQWSTELPEHMVIVLAVSYIRKAHEEREAQS